MKTFYICSTYCVTREADSQKIYPYLIDNGFCFTKDFSKADLIIIATCAVNELEEDKSIRAIKYFLKHKSNSSEIIITGCLPKINPSLLKSIGNFKTISPTELEEFDNLIKAKIKFKSVSQQHEINIPSLPFNYVIEFRTFKELVSNFFKKFKLNKAYSRRVIERIFAEKNRLLHRKDKVFYLVIQNGCLGNCTYCAIRYAIGKSRSRPIKDIIQEFRQALDGGYKIIYLAGEDVGAYGVDINTNIVKLLEELFKIKGDYKLKMLEFNAEWLIKYSPDLITLFVKNCGKLDLITVCIQSGSDRILKLMNRNYKINDVKRCLAILNKEMPKLIINGHIIVGFPGETKEDFEKTRAFLKEFKFKYLTITHYDDRPNTISSKMGGKISDKIIKKRISELIKI